MKKVKVACVQMQCGREREQNIEKALTYIEKAYKAGADIVVLPELFERQYFCQERRYDYYDYAESVDDNLAVKRIRAYTEGKNIGVPVSIYERDGNNLYNAVVYVESGNVIGKYRKTHIPDDHYYQEKFYFAPGDTGFEVFKTRVGTVGVGICWDQWFPETARCLALGGAELLIYPTAIGSEPLLGVDSAGHWRRTMQGHAAANLMPVIAANRIGRERVEKSAENGGQESELVFYGTSFMTDNRGAVVCDADRESEALLMAEYDLAEYAKERLEWGLYRDRRPNMYTRITKR